MNKAAQLSEKLEGSSVQEGMDLIDRASEKALHFDVHDDSMCVMHDDGSVNIIEHMGNGVITSEVISSANILKVLHHYRPFKELFKGQLQ